MKHELGWKEFQFGGMTWNLCPCHIDEEIAEAQRNAPPIVPDNEMNERILRKLKERSKKKGG